MKNLNRRIRFSLSGLLVFMALSAFTTFWVSWPRHTAEAFTVKYFAEIAKDDNPYEPGTAAAEEFDLKHSSPPKAPTLVPHRRSILDIIAGRQTFDCEMIEFTVYRGTVVAGPTPFFDSLIRFYR